MHSPRIDNLTKRPIIAILGTLILLFATSQAAIALSEGLNLTSALEFTTSLSSFIKQSALLFFSLISLRILLLKIRSVPQETQSNPWRSFFILLTFISLSNILIDPRGLFRISFVPALANLGQSNKYEFYKALPEDPDLVIFGSSRVFIHSPSYILETLGYNTFNFSSANGSLLNSIIQMRFIDAKSARFPEVFFIETLPSMPGDKEAAASRASFAMLPYMDVDMAGYFLNSTISDVFNMYTFTESIYTLQHTFRNPDKQPKWTFLPDGSGIRNTPAGNPETFLDLVRNTDYIPACTKHSPESVELLTEIIEFANDRNSAVIIFISPWQPDFYSVFLQGEGTYLKCQQLFLELITSLQQTYPNLFFLDFTHIETFGGISDHFGFYDSHHLTSENSKLLLDAAAPTFQQAYQFSIKARGEAP